MRIELKPLERQRVVITGASSGIGLETARRFAAAGAHVLLAARNGEALEAAVEDIRAKGGRAEWLVTDVSDETKVEALAAAATERLGGVDTWVNDAGTSTYGELLEVPIADQRKVFETNYWGVVYGSLAAVRLMREGGGALINLGSVLSDMPSPLMGAYTASKHAVKGFSDCLRLELMSDEVPVAVTVIKPSAINTPFPEHGKNYMDAEAALPPPIYEPKTVARAILHAATHPSREITVGGGGKMQVLGFALAPRLSDKLTAAFVPGLLKKSGTTPSTANNLDGPGDDGPARGGARFSQPFSLFTAARDHPGWVLGAGVALGVLIAGGAVTHADEVRRFARPHLRRVGRYIERWRD